MHLKLKTLECGRLPSSDILTEEQIRDQLDRRGTCLLESIEWLRKTLETGDTSSSHLAASHFQNAFESYAHLCAHPPITKRKGKSASAVQRSSKERKRFEEELADILLQEAHKKSILALDLMKGWKDKLPNTSLPSAQDVYKTIENFTPRNS
jgi:hypothetical protein